MRAGSQAHERRAVAAFVAALSLVALTIVRGGGGGPPLYDSLCTPQTYVRLGATPEPGEASATFSVSELAATQELLTPESPAPQAQMIIAAGTLAAAPGAPTVTVSITPVSPPPARPDGSIDGNVYDFAAISNGVSVPPATGHPVTIGLEASTSGATLTLEHYAGGHWTALKTFASACTTIYDAATPSLGLFALVDRGSSAPPGQGGDTGTRVLLVTLSAVALLGLVIAGGVRRRRHR